MCLISSFITETNLKFVPLRSFFKIINKIFKNVKKIEKIKMDSKKSVNSYEMKKRIGHLISYETIFLAIR